MENSIGLVSKLSKVDSKPELNQKLYLTNHAEMKSTLIQFITGIFMSIY